MRWFSRRGKRGNVVQNTGIRQESETKPADRITIEVDPRDRSRLWGLILRNGWSGRYLGKNRFAVTPQQAEIIHIEGLTFRTV